MFTSYDLAYILGYVLSFFNTRLSFPPFSFTVLEMLIGLTLLRILIYVITEVFNIGG